MSAGMIVSIQEADVVPGNSSGHHSHNVKYLLLQCLLQPGLAAPGHHTLLGRHCCTLLLSIVSSRKVLVAAFRVVIILSPYYCFLSVEGIIIFMILTKVAPEYEYVISTRN